MPMPAPMLQQAVLYIGTLSTDSSAAFERALSDKAVKVLDAADGIEFWTADFPQRKAMVDAVKAGAQKDACVNFLKDRCALVNIGAQLPKPFVTNEFNRSGWFDYFYSEAADFASKEKSSVEDSEKMIAISNALFVKRVASAPKGDLAMPVPYDDIADETFKMVLTILLLLGFHRLPATRQQAVAGDSSDVALIGKMLWAGDVADVQGAPGIKVIDVAYKWRGDSRPYSDIQTANGFSTKAHSAEYAQAKFLTAAWNPFSDAGVTAYLWYRKTATDNCLYNTISVGKASQWRTYLPYPLIKLSGGKVKGLRGYPGVRKVKCRQIQPYGPGSSAVRDVELPVSVTYIYMFVMAGLALDTGAMQGLSAYPEIGVGDIPFKNVYGCIKCVRVHLGEEANVTDDDGMVVRLVRDKVTDDNNQTIKASYGEALFNQMKVAYAEVLGADVVGVKWQASGAGYAAFDPYRTEFKIGNDRYTILEMPSV